MGERDDGWQPSGAPSREAAVLFALALRGALPADELRSAVGTTAADLEQALQVLEDRKLLARRDDGGVVRISLSPTGRDAAKTVIEGEAVELRNQVEPLYREFASLNRTVKAILYRWQVKEARGVAVPNDHSDGRYDALVLDELRAAHHSTVALHERLAAFRARYANYRSRLSDALARAGRGDKSAVAGVTSESFHSVWWELHADLLAILGRARGHEDA